MTPTEIAKGQELVGGKMENRNAFTDKLLNESRRMGSTLQCGPAYPVAGAGSRAMRIRL